VHVRLVASPAWRQSNLARREEIDVLHAQERVEELESSRRRLVKSFFHRDIDDPLLYDAVLNVETLGASGAARVIAGLAEAKLASVEAAR
jgi:cytidylate kinase